MKGNKKVQTILLFAILYGTMFLFGYVENIKGVTYPLIKAEFGISYETQGIMVSVMTLSYMLFCLLGGILIGKKGSKKSILLGFIVMSAGLIGAFFMPRYLFVGAALFLVSAGFGLFEVSTNALATQIFTSRAALLMNLLHFFYGLGSSVSPRAVGVQAGALGWRMAYLLSIPLLLVVFVPAVFARFPRRKGEEPEEARGPDETESGRAGEKIPAQSTAERLPAKKAGFLDALKNPMVWGFSVTLGFMEVVELSSANWAGLYFQDVYRLDPKTAGAAFLSNFYVLFTISRLVSGFVIEKAGYMRSLFVAALASALIFALGFGLGEKGVHVLPGVGFFSAVFWPTIMAVAMGYFREDAPVMTSAMIVISGAMNGGFQLLIGLINRLVGAAWGYRSCLLYAILVAAALFVLAGKMRRPYKGAGK